MELLDVYDKNFNRTGRIVERGNNELNENEYIMVFIIFIKNSEGKYLIQKVSDRKGDYFSTTGGHLKSGEDQYQCLIREVQEEIGFDLSNENYKLIGEEALEYKNAIFNVFHLEKDIDISTLKLQEEEVEYVVWFTKEEILKLIEEGKFLKSHGKMFKKYF